MWVWRAMALPSRLRVLSHLSHERSAAEATMFLAKWPFSVNVNALFNKGMYLGDHLAT